MQAIDAYTSASIADAQEARRRAIDHWRKRATALPAHDPSEPFHSALVEEMDLRLDLFDRGDERFLHPQPGTLLVDLNWGFCLSVLQQL